MASSQCRAHLHCSLDASVRYNQGHAAAPAAKHNFPRTISRTVRCAPGEAAAHLKLAIVRPAVLPRRRARYMCVSGQI
jgi:hypothetical protein